MLRTIRIMTCLFACLFFTNAAEAQHDKYFFTTLAGRAVISRTSGSTWLALQQAQPVELKPGDMVNVEGDGRGELRFPDGTTARLKNNAMLTIMRYGINQRLGNIWLNVRRGSDIFKVVTPLGSCSVLGTSFDVYVDRFGKSAVRVFSGLVAVRAADDSRNR
ncbi:MAG: FecR family protein, partial [Candidatus Riflebacteria bacterium]|nr:FecR family protein [Candidatus Riflebacteria bacterium]